MLLKWIALMLVAAAVWWLLRGRAGRVAAPRPAPPPPLKAEPRARSGPQAMVACSYCELHLPLDEAFMGPDGRPYCSEAHRIAHLADPARRGRHGA